MIKIKAIIITKIMNNLSNKKEIERKDNNSNKLSKKQEKNENILLKWIHN